ncbi:hypothetical protein KC19_5G056900 [Ceratodon purpureus]|uniref:Uncharacterized protein n=1 Tax=Ceratodon purpureus TaxID=3225 RepID=A0A8T0HZ09_CERPU|nr:hypothetical protein KC19_5G056900 [Ceratodon purpureus]
MTCVFQPVIVYGFSAYKGEICSEGSPTPKLQAYLDADLTCSTLTVFSILARFYFPSFAVWFTVLSLHLLRPVPYGVFI